MHVGINLKAALTETAGENSYEVATRQISRYNPIRRLANRLSAIVLKPQDPNRLEPKQKRDVAEIYIEADEDHVTVKAVGAQNVNLCS